MNQRFGNSKKFNKTTVGKMETDKPIVYKLKSESNKELYVGIAKRGRCAERLLEHLTIPKEKITGATKFQTLETKTVEEARKLESALIKKIQPKYNILEKD